ncbi:MAG: HAD hydrolase family protein [Patescibacteria group bacterium]
MDSRLKNKLSRVKLLVSDFDGVMTDGYVYMDKSGRESVRCSRKDGLGVELLKNSGVEVIVLSKENNPVVRARCRKLKIECRQGIASGAGKVSILKEILKAKNLDRSASCYIGDDINDAAAIKYVAVGVAVADSHLLVKKAADYITKAPGGRHAVRELAELILESQGVGLKI